MIFGGGFYAKIYRYIKKPYTPDELLMIVENAIENYQLKLDNENLIGDLKELFAGTVNAIIEALDAAGIKHVPIKELQEKAYSMVGRPDDLQWKDKVVAILEARDGTILDVVREIKPYEI